MIDEAALLRLGRAVQETGYGFVTPTPATHARVNARPDNKWARDLRDVLGWSRPFRDGVLSPALQTSMSEAGVLARALVGSDEAWRSTVRFSTLDGLLFVHSAYPTDAAEAVFFGPDTMRFADAIGRFLEASPHPIRRAVDIGCGAGPGALLVARARPEAEVIGVDINDAALAMTRVNAALAGLSNVVARRSDLLADLPGRFDLVVANPPYLADPAERAYRHGGGPLGAALSLAIVAAAPARLVAGGSLLLYTGAAMVDGHDPFREAAALSLAQTDCAWTYREADPDVFGEELDRGAYVAAERIAAVVLTAARHG